VATLSVTPVWIDVEVGSCCDGAWVAPHDAG
jgi:hypothetical protein